MLKKKLIRHNTVVMLKDHGCFFGRVIKSLPDDKFLWLCGGLHFRISKASDLVVHDDYNGFKKEKWNNRRYYVRQVYMTTLRNLKREAKRYHGENAFNTPLDYTYIQ